MALFQRSIARRTTYKTIHLRGSAQFLSTTEKALQLLQTTRQWDVVSQNIRSIVEGGCSGVFVKMGGATARFGRRTWSHSTEWYASAIGHEAYHNLLYATSGRWWWLKVPWVGKQAERKCLAFQLNILQELHAPESMLRWVREHMENPTYHYRRRRDW